MFEGEHAYDEDNDGDDDYDDSGDDDDDDGNDDDDNNNEVDGGDDDNDDDDVVAGESDIAKIAELIGLGMDGVSVMFLIFALCLRSVEEECCTSCKNFHALVQICSFLSGESPCTVLGCLWRW